jgi:hypothetical protein
MAGRGLRFLGTASSRNWQKKHNVHWYDMLGYGQSEKRADQPTSLDVQREVFSGLPPHIDKAIIKACIEDATVTDIDETDFDQLVAPWLTVERAGGF